MMQAPPAANLSATTGFADNPLDRLAERRDDRAFMEGLSTDPRSRTVIIARDMPVFRAAGDDPFFAMSEVSAIGSAKAQAFLGRRGDVPIFATLLDDSATEVFVPENAQPGFGDSRRVVVPGRDDLVLRDLRGVAIAAQVPGDVVGLLGQAKSLMHWHARHGFCANCGTTTAIAASGWRRECSACGTHHFPRTDPVVIMLAIHGDRCLLGRQPRFPAGFYSALAGFLEPGETVEDAVRREIYEEAGVRVGSVTYLASQPWPFPASLMIGCFGEALDDTITVDQQELEDARWFSRDEVRTMLAGSHPGARSPQAIAIAHVLLKAFVTDGET